MLKLTIVNKRNCQVTAYIAILLDYKVDWSFCEVLAYLSVMSNI